MANWSSPNLILKLQDMMLTIDLIEAYISDHTIDSFLTDPESIITVCYNLRMIGESADAVPREICERYTQVPWVLLRNLRSSVTNDYFRQNPRILWMACKGRVFPVGKHLANLLKDASTAPVTISELNCARGADDSSPQ